MRKIKIKICITTFIDRGRDQFRQYIELKSIHFNIWQRLFYRRLSYNEGVLNKYI